MGAIIDERVVQMTFDSKEFAARVKETMALLQQLQESLKFQDAGRGFTALTKASKNVQFDNIQNAVEKLEKRFSGFGIVGMTTIYKLTNAIENKLGGAVKGLWGNTFGQMKSGGMRRALNIKNADFQMKGLLKDAEDMEAQVKKIGENIDFAVKGTAYSYDAAAKVASQLLASQVKPGEDMQKALRAISGLAAMTNTSYEEIGQIMTSIAGAGRVTNESLMRFSYRGMNATAALAKELGKTEEQVKKMVKKGEVDFQTFANAMDNAFGEHATAANETYTGSLDNMKAALSRIGAVYYNSHLDVMRDVFNALRVAINSVNVAITPFIQKINAVERAIGDRLIKKIEQFTKWLDNTKFVKDLKAANDATKEAAKAVSEYSEIVNKVIRGDYGNGKKRVDKLTAANYDYATVQALVNKQMYGYDKAIEDLTDEEIKKIAYDEAQLKALTALRDSYKAAAQAPDPVKKPMTTAEKFLKTITNFVSGIKSMRDGIKKAFKEVFPKKTIDKGFETFMGGIVDFAYKLSKLFKGKGNKRAKQWHDLFKFIFGVIKEIFKTIAGIGRKLKPIFTIAKNLFKGLSRFTKGLKKAFDEVFPKGTIRKGIVSTFGFVVKCIKTISKTLKGNKGTSKRWYEIFKLIFNLVKDIVGIVVGGIKLIGPVIINVILGALKIAFDLIYRIAAIINDIADAVKKVGSALWRNFLEPVVKWFKDTFKPLFKDIKKIWKFTRDLLHGSGVGFFDDKTINGFVDKIDKAGEFIRNLFENVKKIFGENFSGNLHAMSAKLEGLQPIIDKIKEKFGAFTDKLKGVSSHFKDIPQKIQDFVGEIKDGRKFTDKFQQVVGKLNDKFSILKDRLESFKFVKTLKEILGKIGNQFEKFVGIAKTFLLEKLPDKLGFVAKKAKEIYGYLKDSSIFEKIIDKFKSLFEDLKSGSFVSKFLDDLIVVKDFLVGLFGGEEAKKYLSSASLENAVDPGAFGTLKQKLENLIQPIKDLMENLFGDPAELGKKAKEAIQNMIQGIADAFSLENYNMDTAKKLLMGLAVIAAGMKLLEKIRNFGRTKIAVVNVIQNIADVFDAAETYIDAKAFALNAKSVMQVAKAMLLMVVAVLALGNMDEEKLRKASVTIIAIALGVGFFMWALGKLQNALGRRDEAANAKKNLENAAEEIKNVKDASAVAAKEAKDLGMTIATGFVEGFKVLMGGLKDAAKIVAKGIAHSMMILALIYALTQVAKIIREFSSIEFNDKTISALTNMGIAILILVTITKIMSAGKNHASIGDALIFVTFAYALMSFAKAVLALSLISSMPGFWNAALALYGFMAMVVVLALVMKEIGKTTTEAKKVNIFSASGGGKSMLALSVAVLLITAAMGTFAKALNTIVHIPPKAIDRGMGVLGKFFGALVVLMLLSRDYTKTIKANPGALLAMGVSAILLSIAISMLVPALTAIVALAEFKPAELFLATAIVGALMIVMGIVASLGGADNGKGLLAAAAAIIVFAYAVSIIATALTVMSNIQDDTKAIDALIEVLLVLGVTLAALTFLAQYASGPLFAGIGAMMAMGAACLALGAGLWLFAEASKAAGEGLPALGFGLAALAGTIIANAPKIFGAILVVIGAITLALKLGAVMLGQTTTIMIGAIIMAAIVALSQMSPEFIQQAGEILGKGIVNLFMLLWTALVSALGTLGTWIATTLPAWFREQGGTLLYSLGAIFASVFAALARLFGTFGNWVRGMLGMDPIEGTWIDNLEGEIDKWVDAIKKGEEKVDEATKGSSTDRANNAFFEKSKEIDEGAQAVSQSYDNAKDQIQSSQGGFLDSLSNNDILSSIMGAGEKEGEAGADGFINKFTEKFGDFNLSGFVGESFLGSDISTAMSEGGGEAGDALIQGFGNAILNGEDVSSYFADLTDDSILNAFSVAEINSPSKRTEELGSGLIEGLKLGIDNNKNSAIDALSSAVNAMCSGLNGFAETLSGVATNAMGTFKSKLSENATGASESVKTAINNIPSKVAGFPDAMGALAAKGSTQFKAGITNGKKKAQDAAKAMADAVKGKLNIANSMWNLAVNAASSFVNGIKSKIRAAAEAAARLASESYNKAKSTLDINSPSKKFRELGYGVGEGFIMGIERMSGAVQKTTANMADDATVGMQKALRTFDSFLASELNLSPVITPVLDLNTVQSGIGTLDTMVARSSAMSMLGGLNANNSKWTSEQSINNSLNAIAANSGNGDIVSAIMSLKQDNAELREAIASMRVVLNNRFVGQIDTSLGRQQKLVNRG